MSVDVLNFKPLIRSAVFKVAGRQVSKEDVDDLVSDIITELLANKLAKYIPEKGMELSTYVFMVASQYTINRMRRHRPTDELPAEMAEAQDFTADALTLLVRREQRGRLARALEALPAEDRVFMERLMGDDTDINALAQEMGVRPNVIYVRKHRILKHLRAMIASGDES